MVDPAGIEHIETFGEGDIVPEWLITIDPAKAQTEKLELRFSCAIAVVKAWGEFWLIPAETATRSLIKGNGYGGDYSIRATEIPLVMPLRFQIMGRPGGVTMTL
jgi:hypothetical protein